MILTNLEELISYERLHQSIPLAVKTLLDYREEFSLVPEGKSGLEDSGCFCIKVEGPGRGKEASPLEAHRAYIDIQYTVEGTDIIGWKGRVETDLSSGYDEQQDIEFFPESLSDTWLEVPAGRVLVLFPEDLHAPMACETEVKKLVIKIPVA